MISVDQSYAGQTIDVPAGQVMELRLPENPTTGFRWVFTSAGGPACVLSGDSFRPPTSGALGAGGEHRWDIRAVQPGICELSLAYRRSFESGPAERSFTIRVRVTG
jgi:inhibitor of cysteine peptidase